MGVLQCDPDGSCIGLAFVGPNGIGQAAVRTADGGRTWTISPSIPTPRGASILQMTCGDGRRRAAPVRRVCSKPLGDLRQLRRKLLLGHRLAVPPRPFSHPHRPPRLPGLPRRVHRDPAPHLNNRTTGITGRLARVAAHAGLASRRATRLPPAGRASRRHARAGLCCPSVDIGPHGRYLRHGDPSLPAYSQVRGLTTLTLAGSRDRTRTYNLPVNSRTLCRLSYAGPHRSPGTGLGGSRYIRAAGPRLAHPRGPARRWRGTRPIAGA